MAGDLMYYYLDGLHRGDAIIFAYDEALRSLIIRALTFKHMENHFEGI